MKNKTIFALMLAATSLHAQEYHFDLSGNRKVADGYTAITETSIYTDSIGYGYDLQPAPTKKSNAPYFFSVKVPDGNYHVTVTLGSKKKAGNTSVRGESRRLFIENQPTKKGELKEYTFTINKRTPVIDEKERVRIKPREKSKLNWDNKLTLEFNGEAPACSKIVIKRVEDVPTIFLCGNSTVVDQDNEPWASWGQMIPRFFTDQVCFANYAESGESSNTFIGANRLKKALSQMKAGDYIFVEFGHNDEKQKKPGCGAWGHFIYNLKIYIDEARARGAYPVLVTPTQRRNFKNGKLVDTHGEFPAAVKFLAEKTGTPLIDLQQMTTVLYEALGVEDSKKALVHYPAGTWPGQTKDFADNTHFNPYGAYQIAKCVIEGIKKANLPLTQFLREDYPGYDPAQPDAFDAFHWNNSPFTEIEKPDGN
ncbi:MAG: rhamnogalacturonan acetylesterase [Bacteroidaceae bacterium]|nr:rhamnogalacturonan acetylesterase [Bacteroidaceae bacterium]